MNGVLLIAIASFLLGSIPFGIVFARIFGGEDVRKKGSGNIGATNVSRVVGFWPAGFLTFACDALKGTLAVLLADEAASSIFQDFAISFAPAWAPGTLLLRWMTAAFVVAGHCFSPWLRFRGGKGVATGFGAFALLSPWASLVGIVGFALAFLNTRIGSLASLSGLLLLVTAYVVLPGFVVGAHLVWGGILIFIVLARHEKNLDALLESRESRFE
jgi:glycerol-3-phosphate acyltransferase PlsY